MDLEDKMEYIIYCDESSSQGEMYTDFFGGCLVDGRYINQIVREFIMGPLSRPLF